MSETAGNRGYAATTLDLPGWTHVYSGKVRDLYEPADGSIRQRLGQDCVLVVASDRISAYDHVLSSEIPDKGRILTQLSLWWFDQLGVNTMCWGPPWRTACPPRLRAGP